MKRARTHTALETDNARRFLYCWVFPKATEQVYSYCQNFVAMDGSFREDPNSQAPPLMTR